MDGRLKLLLGIAAVAILASQYKPSPEPVTAQKALPVAQEPADGCDRAASRKRTEKLFAEGEITNGPKDGANVNVTVPEYRWRRQSYAWKNFVAQDLNCALVGPGKALTNLVFRSDRSNRVVGTWNGVKLTILD